MKYHTRIYCDGSFSNGNLGWSIVITKKRKILKALFGSTNCGKSSGDAEKAAIEHAMKWIDENKCFDATIYSDCKEAIKELKGNGYTIRHVRSHGYNRWHDFADALAKIATMSNAESIIKLYKNDENNKSSK